MAVDEPLRRYLASRGLSATDIDDLVQETALRALETRVPFTDGADLRRWCFVVAKRLHVDVIRTQARRGSFDRLPERDDVQAADLLTQVEDRHLLGTVLQGLRTLREPDRSAVLMRSERADARERNRSAVARYRARQRLLRIVGLLAAFTGAIGRLRRYAAGAFGPAAIVGAPMVVMLALFLIPGSSASTRRDEPEFRQAVRIDSSHLAPGDAAERRENHGSRAPEAQRRVSPHPKRTVAPSSSTLAEAHGPGGAVAFVRTEENTPSRPLVCVDPDLTSPVCVAKPSPPAPDPA